MNNDGVWMYAPGRFKWASKHWWWVEYLFSGFVWYRRFHGGHWELWWNDLTKSEMWMPVPECTQLEHNVVRSIRPPCCYGTPRCEDYKAVPNA
jgi:hypothetical protein